MGDSLFPLTIDDQIACVEREIRMRERVYPRWVGQGKMTQAKADHETAVMREALVSLQMLAGPIARLKGSKPLVLYFANEADRKEVADLILAANPGMVEAKLP